MARYVVGRWVAVVAGLFLMTLASRSDAQLGCFTDVGEPEQSFATCTTNQDCAPVGGSECTSDVCFCDSGPQAPFCPCAAADPPAAAAPSLSQLGLLGLVGLLILVGALQLWRRGKVVQRSAT